MTGCAYKMPANKIQRLGRLLKVCGIDGRVVSSRRGYKKKLLISMSFYLLFTLNQLWGSINVSVHPNLAPITTSGNRKICKKTS